MKGLAVPRQIEHSEPCLIAAMFDNGSDGFRLLKDKAERTDFGILHLHFLTYGLPVNVLNLQNPNPMKRFGLGML